MVLVERNCRVFSPLVQIGYAGIYGKTEGFFFLKKVTIFSLTKMINCIIVNL